jgi:hypothetical protein
VFEVINETSESHLSSHRCEPWIEQVDFRFWKYTHPKQSASHSLPVKISPDCRHGIPSLDQIYARLKSRPHIRQQVSDSGAIRRLPRLPSCLPPLNLMSDESSISVEIQPRPSAEGPEPASCTMLPEQYLPPLSPAGQISDFATCNSLALDSRERRAHDMLSTLRSRMARCSDAGALGGRSGRRRSAPPDLSPLRQRTGFEHPVLALPCGF